MKNYFYAFILVFAVSSSAFEVTGEVLRQNLKLIQLQLVS